MTQPSNRPYSSGWLLGRAGGIGAAAAKVLLEKCDLLCCADRKTPADSVDERELFLSVDLSSPKGIDAFVSFAKDAAPAPQVLLIAAGEVLSKPLGTTTPEEIDGLYRNNLMLATLALAAFGESYPRDPTLPKSVIIISSNAGVLPRPHQAVYAAMKAAVISLGRSAALDWGEFNVRVNVVAPGTVLVPRNESSLRQRLPDLPRDPSRPLGRIAAPSDLRGVLELLLDPRGLITGQTIVVDGGTSLNSGRG